MVGNRKQRQWVIQAAKELGLMPTIEGGLDFKMNLTVVLDGYPGSEHSYPIMPLSNDVVQPAARSGITYTPTLLVNSRGPLAQNSWHTHRYHHHKAHEPRLVPRDERHPRRQHRAGL